MRYARQLSLPELGPTGQARLQRARVLLVGAGGLGSPAALYLAGAGVGHLTIVDADRVELSNLHRQILHATADVGRAKVESARDRIAALNAEVAVETVGERLTRANARALVAGHDVVVDGSDNFATRYAVGDASVALGVPHVFGAATRWDGQAAVFAPTAGYPDGPCYRCLFPEPPAPGTVPSCEEGGVLGVVPGLVGMVQGAETLKLLLGVGDVLAGRLLLVDALRMRFHTVAVPRDPGCPACGAAATGFEALGARDAAVGRAHAATAPAATDPIVGNRVAGDVIEPTELAARLGGDDPPGVIDVREPWEWAAGHVAGAVLAPLGTLERVGEPGLDPARETVVLCARGPRSERAAALLRARGFERVRVLAGGMARWAEDGHTVTVPGHEAVGA